MNRNLSPDEFEEQFLDLSPGAGQVFEVKADRDAREAVGMPDYYAGVAGRDSERRSVSGMQGTLAVDLFGDASEEDMQAQEREVDRRWEPPPGRLN
ncbi:MAG: hypothetical protein ABR616_18045 [Dermatophilaceae bacterium]